MEKFTVHTGVAMPLRRSDVDTDQIIPAEYLKRVTRTGFEDGLFNAWRADESFVLNDARYAGAEWRFAGCSMCLGMNPDTLSPGQRAASTSNRNFEGRQGRGGRTHLVSPQVAAATAVVGRLAAPADLHGEGSN